jgi:hypothetical protein
MLFALALPLAGCGTTPSCEPATMSIVPASVMLSHTATPPANQQQFIEEYVAEAQPGCSAAVPAIEVAGPLTSSDPIDVSVSSEGVASCLNATNGLVTLSSTLTKKTATITCQ